MSLAQALALSSPAGLCSQCGERVPTSLWGTGREPGLRVPAGPGMETQQPLNLQSTPGTPNGQQTSAAVHGPCRWPALRPVGARSATPGAVYTSLDKHSGLGVPPRTETSPDRQTERTGRSPQAGWGQLPDPAQAWGLARGDRRVTSEGVVFFQPNLARHISQCPAFPLDGDEPNQHTRAARVSGEPSRTCPECGRS